MCISQVWQTSTFQEKTFKKLTNKSTQVLLLPKTQSNSFNKLFRNITNLQDAQQSPTKKRSKQSFQNPLSNKFTKQLNPTQIHSISKYTKCLKNNAPCQLTWLTDQSRFQVTDLSKNVSYKILSWHNTFQSIKTSLRESDACWLTREVLQNGLITIYLTWRKKRSKNCSSSHQIQSSWIFELKMIYEEYILVFDQLLHQG